MAATVEPRSGINHSWAFGESGWNTGMDANLLSIGRFAYHPSVKDRDLATPPGSPADGDSYIVGATATGAWASQENKIAVWDATGAAWVFGTPRLGWSVYVEDESVFLTYSGSAWAGTGTAITGGTIDNTVIGGTTPAPGSFTTLTATGATTLSGSPSVINSSGASQTAYLIKGGTNGASAAVTWYDGINVFATDGTYEIKNTSGNGLSLAPVSGNATFDGNLGLGGAAGAGYRFDIQASRALSLQTSTTGTNDVFHRFSNTGGNFTIGRDDSAGTNQTSAAYSSYLWSTGAYPMIFATNNIERLRIDSAGNLGLGVTPSAWSSSYRAIQNGQAAFMSRAGGSDSYLLTNNYYNGTNFVFINSAAATRYDQDSGAHKWYRSTDGTPTADDNVTWDQAMTLDASGNLLVNRTTTSGLGKLNVDGGADITGGNVYLCRDTGNLLVGTASGTYNQVHKTSTNDYVFGVFNQSATQPYGMIVNYAAAAPNNATETFLACSDTGAVRALIRSNGGIANYQANDANLSDEREKNLFGALESTTDCVRHWDIIKYLYKDEDQSNAHKYGVIAQQVAPHCPEVISTWVKQEAADEVLWAEEDELPDGVSVGDVKTPAQERIERMGVKEQQMFWMLVKSHQEALDTIDALEARIAALESA